MNVLNYILERQVRLHLGPSDGKISIKHKQQNNKHNKSNSKPKFKKLAEKQSQNLLQAMRSKSTLTQRFKTPTSLSDSAFALRPMVGPRYASDTCSMSPCVSRLSNRTDFESQDKVLICKVLCRFRLLSSFLSHFALRLLVDNQTRRILRRSGPRFDSRVFFPAGMSSRLMLVVTV
jgi:hypothetical protein